MGYIKHHSIIVTGEFGDLEKARTKCLQIFRQNLSDHSDLPENIISPIMSGLVNGYSSFFIAPDGSKEGWETSDNCDTARDLFLTYLKESRKYDFIELCFGGDDENNFIVN